MEQPQVYGGYTLIIDDNNEKTQLVNRFGNNTNGIIEIPEIAYILHGGDGNDNLTGQQLFGEAGNDILRANSSRENRLDGGEGNDTLYGNGTDDFLDGSEGNDVIYGNDPSGITVPPGDLFSNQNYQATDNDYLDGDNGDDSLYGFKGNDTLEGGDGRDHIVAGPGNDVLIGGTGNDTLLGQLGNDTLEGGTGDDSLYGGFGDDIIFGGHGSDYISGANIAGEGGDYDTVQFGENNGAGVYIDLSGNDDNVIIRDEFGDSDTINRATIEAYRGTSGDDYMLCNGLNVDFFGEGGNDTLTGGAGDNNLDGGSGNDNLFGEGGNDTLTGGAGSNNLDGGSGNDTLNGTLNGGLGFNNLYGGIGDDIYVVDSLSVIITENPGEGTDTIQSSVTFSIMAIFPPSLLNPWALTNIENLTLTGTTAINGMGNTANNTLIGNTANNTLRGYAGNDILNGGAGIDELIGGLGDDIYQVDTTTDVITELAAQGTDTVQSSVTFSLATLSNIENLTLTGTAAINGTGNAANNTLTGNAGNDILNGGTGIDTLIGGLGDDIYQVDTTTDVITELAAQGTDTVQSSVTFSLATLTNIENLTLTGTTAINGTGNTANNTLIGNTSNNTLTGDAGNDILNGAAGIDTLIGGLGDDIYQVDTVTDIITELAAQGTDTIQSSVTFSLATLINIENLTLTGTTAINGTGNTVNNAITGNTANNSLIGDAGNDILNGGAGIDTLIGGLGNDIYQVDTTTDVITELATQGTDTVQSSVTFSLAALTNIENLTLTGTTVINGTGNAVNNVITGNSVNNILTGATGKDTLTGGLGSDRFGYKILTDSFLANFDVITDFNANASNDLFLVTTARSSFTNVGAVATLDNTGIIAKLTNANFGANSATQFTFGTRTFVAINDATAGFSQTTDAVIEITGLTGTLGLGNFVTV